MVCEIVASVEQALTSHRFRFTSERVLQDGIELVLRTAGLAVEREAPLGTLGTIDFLVGHAGSGRVGVEVKVRGLRADVTRQVHRYVQSDTLSALVVVTTRALLARLPETMNGKRVHTIHLTSGAW